LTTVLARGRFVKRWHVRADARRAIHRPTAQCEQVRPDLCPAFDVQRQCSRLIKPNRNGRQLGRSLGAHHA
jgi:hypothetical protein